MKTFIGIIQSLDETAKNIIIDRYEIKSCIEVGPFPCHEAAMAWLQFMESRSAEVKHFSEVENEKMGLWYGYILECEKISIADSALLAPLAA